MVSGAAGAVGTVVGQIAKIRVNLQYTYMYRLNFRCYLYLFY